MGANLRGANLRETNFIGANLRGASLQGATIDSTYFSRADVNETLLPSNNADHDRSQ